MGKACVLACAAVAAAVLGLTGPSAAARPPLTPAIAVNPGPGTAYGPVVLTATLPPGTAGAVVFREADRILATAPIDPTGVASATVTTLGAGPHNVSAALAGSPARRAHLVLRLRPGVPSGPTGTGATITLEIPAGPLALVVSPDGTVSVLDTRADRASYSITTRSTGQTRTFTLV